jgi:hypothetical protein
MLEQCAQPVLRRCNHKDPGYCCGGGRDGPCQCSCHEVIVTTHRYKPARAGLRRAPNALCLICLQPNRNHVVKPSYDELERELVECQKVRNEWCAEYTKLRDAARASAHPQQEKP